MQRGRCPIGYTETSCDLHLRQQCIDGPMAAPPPRYRAGAERTSQHCGQKGEAAWPGRGDEELNGSAHSGRAKAKVQRSDGPGEHPHQYQAAACSQRG